MVVGIAVGSGPASCCAIRQANTVAHYYRTYDIARERPLAVLAMESAHEEEREEVHVALDESVASLFVLELVLSAPNES